MSLNNTAVVGGAIYVHPDFIEAHKTELSDLAIKLRLLNPEYKQALSLRDKGKYVQMPDKYVQGMRRLPIAHAWGNGLQIPRCVDFKISGVSKVDKTSCPEAESLSLAEGIKLRDYQNQAVKNFILDKQGVVIAPCGAGKTTIGIGVVAHVNTPALILVHTLDLAKQWQDRVESQLGHDAAVIGGGTNELEKGKSNRVVIATFQTICRWGWDVRYNFAKQFGLLIVDEAHHVPASTFCEALMTMPQRYRLGLTATPERPDGLTKMLHWHMGEVISEITTQDLIARGLIMQPLIKKMYTGWNLPDGPRPEWTQMVTSMCKDDDRTQLILDKVDICVRQHGRQVLVLSDRVAHCEQMAKQLQDEGLRAAALVGKVSKTKRAELLKKADSREIDVIFATSLADEGLDLPGLDTVFLTVPTKAMGRIQQRIGRIMRTREGKQTPIVFDVVDDEPFFVAMSRKRTRLYNSLGCQLGE